MIESITRTLGRLNEWFCGPDHPVGVFFLSLGGYAIAFFIIALAGSFALRGLALGIRSLARRLASGGDLDSLKRLEEGSARIADRLRWASYRLIRLGYAEEISNPSLPKAKNESGTAERTRSILRKTWLATQTLINFIRSVVASFTTVTGLLLLALAFMTALPTALEQGVRYVIELASTPNVSKVSLISTTAALLTILLVIIRVAMSDTARANRAYRDQKNETALSKLSGCAKSIEALASAIDTAMADLLPSFVDERELAQRWYTNLKEDNPPTACVQGEHDDHTDCDNHCLDSVKPKKAPAPSPALLAIASELENVWNSEIEEHYWTLLPLLSRRARLGLISLSQFFDTHGKFQPHLVPSPGTWHNLRVGWQHRHLRLRPSRHETNPHSLEVYTSLDCSPNESWLEDTLLTQLWKLAERRRRLSDLIQHVDKPLPRPIENLLRAIR